MPLPVRGIALPVLVVLGLFASTSPTAQIRPGTPTASRAVAARLAAPSAPSTALSGPVDPETYRVGPGDVFVLSIGGAFGTAVGQTTATVTADGLLVVPQAGTFQVAGRTLAAVRSDVRAALRSLYRNVPTDVALATPRQFSVYVSGAVPAPGRQTVSALGRVEDAVAAASGTLSPLALADYTSPIVGPDRRVALRNVRVTSPDGTQTTADLLRYYATGDLTFNPVLTDGDAVLVTYFDPAREGVTVDGEVDRPGTYDARPGDTAAALVAVAGGPQTAARGATVRRSRMVGGETESVEVPLDAAAQLDIAPRDQITVRSATPDAGLASAVGAVAFPGTYPIQVGQTTLAELVEAAGGLAQDALLRGAYLERLAPSAPSPTRSEADSLEATPAGRLSPLGLAGRRYYTEEIAATPRLTVDLSAALSGAEPVVLRDGDRLVVPRDVGAIRVTGQVEVPGYVPFQAGRTAGDYVARAGGLGPVATTVYTVDARTGLFTAGLDTPVHAGDAVFVDRPSTFDSPEFQSLDVQTQNLALQKENLDLQRETLDLQRRREEREVRAARRQLVFQTISTLLAAAGTVITAILVTSK